MVSSRKLGTQKGSFQTSNESADAKYELHYSIILDSGSIYYIGNNKARFSDFQAVLGIDNNYFIAGDTIILIKGYGSYMITI